MWANDVTRQAQSNPPWPPGTIVTAEVLAQYADWKQVPDNYEIPQTAEEIQSKIKQQMTNFVQSILDAEALKHNYDNIVSATSYAGYVNQFQAEGIAFGVWRSAVWAKCYEIMADVLSGKRQVPTESELIAELPKLTL